MITGHNELQEFLTSLNGEKVFVYAGIDPTGKNIHLGHLGFISLLDSFKTNGHNVNIILGTGTAHIGDPTGKNEMRKMLDNQTIEENVISLQKDIEQIIPNINFVRNDWLRDLNLQTFMREAGSRIPLNDILNLSIVKTRLENGSGISLMEAIYPVLQAWDMVVMAKKAKELGFKKIVQCGGKDQTGNIALGLHLVKRLVDDIEPFGCLNELIVSSNGEKMGKTSGNALFVNPEITSDLLFFDSIVSTSDDLIPSMVDVLAPFLDKKQDIMKLKKTLAIVLLGWIRGEESVINVLKIKEKGFDAGNLQEFIFEKGISISKILKEVNFASSLGDARRLIKNSGIKIDDSTISDDIIFHDVTEFVLSKGKKNHCKVIIK